MNFNYKITLFTPTYNRAHLLPRLYESVKRQTFKDFEWVVVDDGSTDNTEKLFDEWKADNNSFPIRYFKKENGGKMRAINYGVDKAEGLLFFNVDSDDYLTDDALEKVAKWEGTLPHNGKFCGVVGNLGTSETETPNTLVEEPYRDASLLERYADYTDKPIDGEHAWVFYTEIQKRYKYPEFDGEKFVTEAISWNRMANDGYLVRVFNDIICVYEYQENGLTASGSSVFVKNPQGHGLWLKEKSKFCRESMKSNLRMYYSFYCDHSFCEEKYRLTKKQCAEYIGAPYIAILGAALVHKLSSIIKK